MSLYHADGARKDDRYGMIPALPYVNLSEFNVIEVEVIGKRVTKIVIRGELDDINDIVLVVIPTAGSWTVKTTWLNRNDDKHKTLNRSRYVN